MDAKTEHDNTATIAAAPHAAEAAKNAPVDAANTSSTEDAHVALVQRMTAGTEESMQKAAAADEQLRARAKDALLTQAIASEEQLGAVEPAEDLLTMDGMDRHLAFILASRGIVTMEDLAEQSIDELLEIEGMEEERAGQLIMTARAPWFAESAE